MIKHLVADMTGDVYEVTIWDQGPLVHVGARLLDPEGINELIASKDTHPDRCHQVMDICGELPVLRWARKTLVGTNASN